MEVKYLEIHYETLELFTDELLLYVVLWSGMLILDLYEVTDVKFEKSFEEDKDEEEDKDSSTLSTASSFSFSRCASRIRVRFSAQKIKSDAYSGDIEARFLVQVSRAFLCMYSMYVLRGMYVCIEGYVCMY